MLSRKPETVYLNGASVRAIWHGKSLHGTMYDLYYYYAQLRHDRLDFGDYVFDYHHYAFAPDEMKTGLIITTDWEHVHTDAAWSEQQVLDKALQQSLTIHAPGSVLIDVKEIEKTCPCALPPNQKTWLLLFYYLENFEGTSLGNG